MEKEIKRDKERLVAAVLVRWFCLILFVSKDDRLTIPTETYERKKEADLKDTAYRGLEEELGIKEEEIDFEITSLGTHLRNKGSPVTERILFEFFPGKVTREVARKIKFKEGEQFWLYPIRALRECNLDGLAVEGVRRYLRRHPVRRGFLETAYLFYYLTRRLKWWDKKISDFSIYCR